MLSGILRKDVVLPVSPEVLVSVFSVLLWSSSSELLEGSSILSFAYPFGESNRNDGRLSPDNDGIHSEVNAIVSRGFAGVLARFNHEDGSI